MTEASHSRDTWRGFAAAAAVVICWSGFNIVSRLGGKSSLTPFDLAALRFGIAGTILLPAFIRRDIPQTWLQLLVLALFGGVGYSLLVYSGFVFAPAAHAGVLVNGGIPLATALVGALWFGYRPSRVSVFALVLTAVGMLCIGLHGAQASGAHADSMQWLGDLLFVAGAFLWAGFGLLLRKWKVQPLDSMIAVACISMFLYLPVYLLWLPKGLHAASVGMIAMQSIYQGVIAVGLAGFLFAYANRSIGPVRTSLMLALVPSLTSLAAVPILGEAIGLLGAAGIVCVMLGAGLGYLAGRER